MERKVITHIMRLSGDNSVVPNRSKSGLGEKENVISLGFLWWFGDGAWVRDLTGDLNFFPVLKKRLSYQLAKRCGKG
jgi:hypothetical protein